MERKITSIWSVNYTQDLLKTDSSKDLLGMINLKFCKMNSNICKIIFELAILSKKKKEKKKVTMTLWRFRWDTLQANICNSLQFTH